MKEQPNAMPGAGPCPDREFVSCYLDRELAADTPESRHISDCPRCGQTVAAYARIGCGLKEEMAAAVPADLCERVRGHVLRRLEEEQAPSGNGHWWLWPARVAALLALASLALFAGRGLISQRQELVTAAGSRPAASAVPASSDDSSPAMPLPELAPSGQVPIGDLAPASTGMTPFRFVPADAGEARPALIPEAVRHVWLSHDPTTCCAKFAAAAVAAGIKAAPTMSEDGARQVEMVASRRQVVDLVRHWAKGGHRLLTPTAPQPEQNTFIGTGDEPVRYAAVFAAAKP